MTDRDVRAQLRRELLQAFPVVAAVLFGLNHGLYHALASSCAGLVLTCFFSAFIADRCECIPRFLKHPLAGEVILQVQGFCVSIALLVDVFMEPTAVVPLVLRSLSLMSVTHILEYKKLRRMFCALEIGIGLTWVAYCVVQGEPLCIQDLLNSTGGHLTGEDSWKVRCTIAVLLITFTCIHLRYLCLWCKIASGTNVIVAQHLAQVVPDAPDTNVSQAVSKVASQSCGGASSADGAIGPYESTPVGQATAQEEAMRAPAEHGIPPPQPVASDMKREVLLSKAKFDQKKRSDQDPQAVRGGAASSAASGKPFATSVRGETPSAENAAKLEAKDIFEVEA